jgi:hypothetical protein
VFPVVTDDQDVYPNSPAATAGLRPYTDYVIGAPELVFNDSEDFFMLVQNNIGKQIQLYVYNAEEDAVRTVWHRIRLDFRSALPRPAAFFFVLPFSLHYLIVTIFRNDDQVTIVPSNDWGGNGWYSSRNRIPNPLFVSPPSEHFLIFFFQPGL